MKKFSSKKLKEISKIFGNETNLKILLCLSEDSKNFLRIKKECNVCSPSALNSIKILLKYKLVKKKIVKLKPKRVIYALTDKGLNYIKVLKYIMKKFLTARPSRRTRS